MYSNTSSLGGTGWSVGRSSVPNDRTVTSKQAPRYDHHQNVHANRLLKTSTTTFLGFSAAASTVLLRANS